jgi:hypothetical protein
MLLAFRNVFYDSLALASYLEILRNQLALGPSKKGQIKSHKCWQVAQVMAGKNVFC